jgi:hypothetical protein
MKLLTAIALALLLSTASAGQTNVTPRPSYSTACADSAVVLTTEQADSLVLLIDELELERDLLEIDLRVCRDALPGPEMFLVRWAKHPAVWLVVGMTIGVYATK